MPKSKTNPKRKKNLQNYKNKTKTMNQNAPSLPPVRNIPTWNADAKIEVTGAQWEAMFNGLGQLQLVLQAAQAVMSQNVIAGNITVDFEKLNPQTLQYEAMPPDEKAKYQAEFAELVAAFKQQQKVASVAPTEQPAPSGLVSETGEPLTAEPNTNDLQPTKQEAKVVNMLAKPKTEPALEG